MYTLLGHLRGGSDPLCLFSGVHMPFFFLLCGFSISQGYALVDWNWSSTKRFFKKRCIRILPVYYLAQLVTLLSIMLKVR